MFNAHSILRTATSLAIAALIAAPLLTACGGRQGVTPGGTGPLPPLGATGASQMPAPAGHTAGHLIPLVGIPPGKNCPSRFIYCVTVSPNQSAQLYFCYSTGSYCGGPSQTQYLWASWFYPTKGGQEVSFFNGSFNPNPGDPTYDTISEASKVGSTHGKYKYMQIICAYAELSCQVYFYVGIAVK
jgi:hypothetical protein